MCEGQLNKKKCTITWDRLKHQQTLKKKISTQLTHNIILDSGVQRSD